MVRIYDASIEKSGYLKSVVVPCCIVAATAMVASGGGTNMEKTVLTPLPVLFYLPLLVLGVFGALVPPALFLVYNWVLVGRAKREIESPALAATGITIALVATASATHLIRGRDGIGTHVDLLVIDSWTASSGLMLVVCLWLYKGALRSRKPPAVTRVHTMIFVWFYSFAFPWTGEML